MFTNPILARLLEQVDNSLHILSVSVRQNTETEFRVAITYQDWTSDEQWLAGDGGIIEQTEMSRLPDTEWDIDATYEMIEDWMIEICKVGEAVDCCRFDSDGYRSWLTKPLKWRKT